MCFAAQGLVTQGPPLTGDTRQRPWRRCFDEVQLPLPGEADDAEVDTARGQAIGAVARHDLGLFLNFLASAEARSVDWGASTTVHARTVLMTPAELRAWGQAVEEVTRAHVEKARRASRQHRRPVRLSARGFLQAAPETEAADDRR